MSVTKEQTYPLISGDAWWRDLVDMLKLPYPLSAMTITIRGNAELYIEVVEQGSDAVLYYRGSVTKEFCKKLLRACGLEADEDAVEIRLHVKGNGIATSTIVKLATNKLMFLDWQDITILDDSR